jgi:apolipoprotein D and lipocalin family protein
MRIINLAGILLITGVSCVSNMTMKPVDTTTVDQLDLERYLGTWYEVARFPHSFEKGLVGVTASYSLRDDGKIRVINQGFVGKLDGTVKKAEGKAKIPDPGNPARLKVSFFLFFYGDYYVLELDDNYGWAMIGSSSPNYFWILSRKPQMEPEIYQMLLDRAEKRGYDLSRLIKVEQPASV